MHELSHKGTSQAAASHIGEVGVESAPLGLQRAHFVGNSRDGLKVAVRGDWEPGLADGDAQARELMGDCELLRGFERDAGRLLACNVEVVRKG